MIKVGQVCLVECIGCEESVILIASKEDKRASAIMPERAKMVCGKCGGNGIPFEAKGKMALCRCRQCEKVVAILEAGKYPTENGEHELKERTTVEGVCSKCLGTENVIVNVTKKWEEKNDSKNN